MTDMTPIDNILEAWKNSMIENVPKFYRKISEDKTRLRKLIEEADKNKEDRSVYRYYRSCLSYADCKYGPTVRDWGAISANPDSYKYPDFLAYLDKEADRKKQNLIERCNTKIGGIINVEWLYANGNGELEGYVTGPNGRIHLHAILAGGYNIQCLHIRFLMNKVKEKKAKK